jgi:hypothetical protein
MIDQLQQAEKALRDMGTPRMTHERALEAPTLDTTVPVS